MVDADVSLHHFKVRGVKVWPHVDYTVVVDETAKRFRATDMRILAFDETGVGSPVKEMLWRAGIKAEGIKFSDVVEWQSPWGEREHSPIKYAMVELARAVMQLGYVDLPKTGAAAKELIVQMGEQEIMPTSGRPKFAHPAGRHDDLMWAFCMALYVSRRWLVGSGGWFAPVSLAPPLKRVDQLPPVP